MSEIAEDAIEFLGTLEDTSKEDKDKILYKLMGGKEKVERLRELMSKSERFKKEGEEIRESLDMTVRNMARQREKGDEEKLGRAREEVEEAFEKGGEKE